MKKTASMYSHQRLLRYQFEGWLVVILGLFGFLTWAATYPINQGVSGSGYIMSQDEKVKVNAPTTGIIVAIYKKSGDQVKAGDVLLELDSNAVASSQRYNEETIRGVKVSNTTLKSALKARQLQIAALQKQFQSNQQLVESGFASQNSTATIQTQLALAQSEALELQSRIEQNQSKINELNEKNTSIQIELKKQKVIAPIDGTVMSLSVNNSGLLISAGTEILNIIPNTKQLTVEARIPVEWGDRIERTKPVEILFPSILNSHQYRLSGTLDYVSADKIVDEKSGQSFYEAKVGLKTLGPEFEKQLKPGLPALVMVKTGPKTLLSYLLDPFRERLSLGLQ